MARIGKVALYGFLLTAFFWLVQFNDLWRVKWFFDTLIGDGEVASWLMTLVIELGMGLLSLELLSRVTANNQRQRREGKLIGYKQPVALLIFSVLLLGMLETFISVAFFYEFGQVTSLTSRLLEGDTFWVAATFGSVSAILTFVFAAVEGERTRIEQRKSEKEQERIERKRRKAEAEQAAATIERVEARAEQARAETLRQRNEAEPYACEQCEKRFATPQALAGHMRWCKGKSDG